MAESIQNSGDIKHLKRKSGNDSPNRWKFFRQIFYTLRFLKLYKILQNIIDKYDQQGYNTLTFIPMWDGSKPTRNGIRSSMEALFLTCLQSQFLIGKVNINQKLIAQQKNDIVWEIKQITKKGCFIDAKAD